MTTSKPSATNPLRFVCKQSKKTYHEFCDLTGVSYSWLTKHATGVKGYQALSTDLRKTVWRVFGAILRPDSQSSTACPATDIDGEPYSHAAYLEHLRERMLVVKYPAKNIGSAMALLARCASQLKLDDVFEKVMAQAVEEVLSNRRLKAELRTRLKGCIPAESNERNMPRSKAITLFWLAHVARFGDILSELPYLPTLEEHHERVKKKFAEIKNPAASSGVLPKPSQKIDTHSTNLLHAASGGVYTQKDSIKPR